MFLKLRLISYTHLRIFTRANKTQRRRKGVLTAIYGQPIKVIFLTHKVINFELEAIYNVLLCGTFNSKGHQNDHV